MIGAFRVNNPWATKAKRSPCANAKHKQMYRSFWTFAIALDTSSIRHSGNMACPSCANFRRVCTLCIPAHFRTSVSGILSCHMIFRSFLRHLVCKWFSLWHVVGKLSKFRMRIIVMAAPPICILSAYVKSDSTSPY